MEKLNEETKRLMDERFGHDNVIALATQDGDMPDAAHRDCQDQPSEGICKDPSQLFPVQHRNAQDCKGGAG